MNNAIYPTDPVTKIDPKGLWAIPAVLVGATLVWAMMAAANRPNNGLGKCCSSSEDSLDGILSLDEKSNAVRSHGDVWVAANDNSFTGYGGGGEPPDCDKWRSAVRKAFYNLAIMESIYAKDPLTSRVGPAIQRTKVEFLKRQYEKNCGPYTPGPESIDDIYGR
jgi:hypothetical protein